MKYNPDIVVAWFKEHGIVAIPEHRFDDSRKWRFDFVVGTYKDNDPLAMFSNILQTRLALECEGAVWTNGRHTRGSGFVKDMDKYNRAAVLGWRILRVTPQDLCTMDTIEMVKAALSVG